ncbi:MAG TPA: MlaD family protein [Thermoleophilaceae bacterium]|nr:MlaD family protein [Thermoleophilaceae bacterium]
MAIFRRRKRSRLDKGMAPFAAGALVIAAAIIFSYFAYTQSNPFANPYEFTATFESAANLKAKSPVRIAGVNIGTVTKVEPVTAERGARVTMEIDESGLPIHKDATVKIRPRIFLEGNFFVDLEPGSPSAPVLADGDTLPVQQTATPVQFNDLLAALQSDTRKDLQVLLDEFAQGLEGKGARGLNQTYRYAADAYRLSSLANEASLGTRPRDLSRLVRGQAKAFKALAARPDELRALVTNFNTFAASLAREDVALEAAIPALDDVLRAGLPALRELNGSLPALRAFARDALPATRSTGPAIDANLPFIRQARQLVSEDELKGLTEDLRVALPDLVALNRSQTQFLEQGRALSACQSNVLAPFAVKGVPSPDFPGLDGEPFFKLSSRGLVGLSGESRIVDGNSPMFHFNFGSGPYTLVQPGEDGSQTFGSALFPPVGVRPARPDRRPDFRPDVPCETQEVPDLNAPGGATDTQATRASTAKPKSAEDKRLVKKVETFLALFRQHVKDRDAGRPTIDPSPYSTLRELDVAAKRAGLDRVGMRYRLLKRGEAK